MKILNEYLDKLKDAIFCKNDLQLLNNNIIIIKLSNIISSYHIFTTKNTHHGYQWSKWEKVYKGKPSLFFIFYHLFYQKKTQMCRLEKLISRVFSILSMRQMPVVCGDAASPNITIYYYKLLI